MTALTIQLPAAGQFHGAVITDCEWRIRTFVERDAYVGYDWAGSHAHPPGATIQEFHVFVMNSAMRARSSRNAWANFVGKSQPELEAIWYSLDLIGSPAEQIEPALTTF